MHLAVRTASGRIYRPSSDAEIWRRANPPDPDRYQGLIITAVVIGILLVLSLALYFALRYFRAHHYEPKYLPGTWLKRKYKAWMPSSAQRKQFSALQDRSAIQRSRTPSTLNLSRQSAMLDGSSSTAPQSGRQSRQNAQDDNDVDRRTSVRSIATLPAYSVEVRPTEKVIGREGERGGIDTVIEFPETVDEEEARRDEEMEALYQIRRARREERVARDERRRLRREARARGDTATVEELRHQGRTARAAADAVRNNMGTGGTSQSLIQDHRSRERGRRVSSVSYLDLGIARHDGSRVRAGSNESDRLPLMDSAASMGGGSDTSRHRADSIPLQSRRNVSTSSLSRYMTPDVSDDDRSSVELEVVSTRDSRAGSGSGARPRLRLNSSEPGEVPRSAAEPPQYNELTPIMDGSELDRGEDRQPLEPEEEAPAYESPTASGAPRLPGFSRLPSIHVTPFTPDTATPQASFR